MKDTSNPQRSSSIHLFPKTWKPLVAKTGQPKRDQAPGNVMFAISRCTFPLQIRSTLCGWPSSVHLRWCTLCPYRRLAVYGTKTTRFKPFDYNFRCQGLQIVARLQPPQNPFIPTDCPAFQAVGAYCCGESVPDSADICRICGDGTPLPFDKLANQPEVFDRHLL